MNPTLLAFFSILLPFLATSLGAGTVLFMKKTPGEKTKKCLFGFAAGVMVASSVWSLLIPSLESSPTPFPTLTGFLLGMSFFILCDKKQKSTAEKHPFARKNLFFAVTLHNIPEGMAVGVAFAAAFQGSLSFGAAFLIALGIALQNFPEGAILSTPHAASGFSKKKAILFGVLSGTVEPLGAVVALVLTRFITFLLPYVLSFAAGAMLFVVTDELIPSLEGSKKEWGLFSFALGFALMMAMDVIFG
jgi:ZIP family zinc transporter